MNKTVSTKVQSYATGQTMQKRRSKKPKRSKAVEQEQKSKAKVRQPSIVDTPIEETRNVVFKPNEGPQTEFLAAGEREVLYGGSAGGGKSFAMLADPLRYFSHSSFSGLLLRHTTEELRELIKESLRNWFKKEKWVRIDTQGNIAGPCGSMKKGKATTRCLPLAKARSLSKKQRAATARKKVRGSKKGKQFVRNTKKAKVSFKKK